MKIICISGKAQAGKDTTATILKEQLILKDKRVLIAHYADLVKYVARTFFGWNGEKDRQGRAILQKIGTDDVRTVYPNFWVDFILSILTVYKNKWDYVLIPDTRFPNEYDLCKSKGFDTILLRVIRNGYENGLTAEQKNHPSEVALDDYKFDYIIKNNGNLNELKENIGDFIRSIANE